VTHGYLEVALQRHHHHAASPRLHSPLLKQRSVFRHETPLV